MMVGWLEYRGIAACCVCAGRLALYELSVNRSFVSDSSSAVQLSEIQKVVKV